MKVAARLELGPVSKLLEKKNLQLGGAVQRYIDKTVIDLCEPYVPYDNGVLTLSANLATTVGSGQVVYDTLYAHYQYYGEVYGPNILMEIGGEQTFRSPKNKKKNPTGRKLKYSQEVHPLAGSFWFERMKAAHREDILKGACKVAGVKHR